MEHNYFLKGENRLSERLWRDKKVINKGSEGSKIVEDQQNGKTEKLDLQKSIRCSIKIWYKGQEEFNISQKVSDFMLLVNSA